MNYDDDFLQDLTENIDLLSYVSNSIEMKQSGKDWWGHCPLHSDSTPSFSITPEKNVYYCHSCLRGGNILNYMMQFENLSFEEAVEKAARLSGMDLQNMCKSPTVHLLKQIRKSKLKQNNDYHPLLDEEEYSKFRYGSVDEWLAEGIRQKEIDLFEIRLDDRSNRIVYPVRDIGHNLINIKGRTRFPNYKEMRLPKYINYKSVGNLDYFQSLYITLPEVKRTGEIILFESIKSVMKAYGWGFKNAASVEAHNLTNEQIRLLLRLHVDVVIAYDSDVNIRSKEIQKGLNKLKKFTNVYVIEDPCKLLGGAEAKNSPVDCGVDIWNKLYMTKRKIY